MSDVLRNSWLSQRFGDRERFISNSGTRCVPEYTAKVDENGVLDLKVTGERDLWSEIQSHRESCDLSIIVNRIINGDASAADRLKAISNKQGFYADMVVMPKTYAEFTDRLVAAKQFFDRLPVEEKEKYNNDVYQFIANFDAQDVVNDTTKVMSTETFEATTPSASPSSSDTIE